VQVAGPRTRVAPETLHGAPIRGSCYGREIFTVSHLRGDITTRGPVFKVTSGGASSAAPREAFARPV